MVEQPLAVYPVARNGISGQQEVPVREHPFEPGLSDRQRGFAHRPMDGCQPFNPSERHSWSVAEDQSKKIEELTARIAELESAVREVARPYSELVDQLSRFQDTVQKYFRLMDLYQRHGVIPIETILPGVKDPISKDIMRLLLDKPGLNISEITEELRQRRGSASRRIVRDRLGELLEKGMLVERTGKMEKTYNIRVGGQEMVRSARIDQVGWPAYHLTGWRKER